MCYKLVFPYIQLKEKTVGFMWSIYTQLWEYINADNVTLQLKMLVCLYTVYVATGLYKEHVLFV